MLEFGVRILLAGATILLAGITGGIGFSLAVGVAVGLGLLALAGHALASRKLYDGAGAGLHTALEGFALALLLVSAGFGDTLGFLVLVPYAWAATRHGAAWVPGAFAAAFALVGAQALINRSEPTSSLLLQAGGTLLLGLFLGIPTPVELPVAEGPVSSDDTELRARFRALREAYNVLDRRAKEDAHTAALIRATTPDAIAQSVRDATAASGAILFVPGEDGWEISGSAGIVPSELREPVRNARALQEKGAVLLFAGGRPVGAVWTPSESRDTLTALAETLSVRFSDRLEMEAERRQRQATELRVTLVEGGDSPDAVAQALAATIGADSVEFGVVGPLGVTALGHFGPPCGLPEAMRHETGPGLAGWAAAGTPITWIGDARADERFDGTVALRTRTSTLALVPLSDGRAYVWAAWSTLGAGRPTALKAMRAAEPVVVRWLGHAAGRPVRTAA